MATGQYVRRPLEVTAVLYTGSNAAEVAAVLGIDIPDEQEDEYGPFVEWQPPDREGAVQRVSVGWWALSSPYSNPETVDPDQFAARYAPRPT